MSHRGSAARTRRHVRQHVRTVDTPSATTQRRATITGRSAVSHNNINNCMCSINSICKSSSTCGTCGTSTCAHARAHTHVRRRPTRRRSPRTAQARRARTDARCTALARPKDQRRRCHFLLRIRLGRIRAAKRSVHYFEITKSCPRSFEIANLLPLRRLCHATTPHGRPARAPLVSLGYHTWAGHSDHRPTQHTVACVAQPATRRIPSPRPGPAAAAVPARLRPRPNASIGDHTDYLAVLPLRRP